MSSLSDRLAALEAYDILDSAPEKPYDDLTELAAYICGTPIATLTLLDAHRQWFKSAIGLSSRESPIEYSFCLRAIEQPEVMEVQDARRDVRFAENPLVTGDPHIRFYAGAPLVTPEGVAIGTICAIDRVPHHLAPEQRQALAALARQAVWMLEMRRTAEALSVALREREAARHEVATLQNLLPMCAWCRKVRDDESFWNDVEDYLEAHSDIRVTHGICPKCAEQLWRESSHVAGPPPAK